MSESLNTQYEEPRSLKLIKGLGGVILCAGLGGVAYNVYSSYVADNHGITNTATIIIDTSPSQSVEHTAPTGTPTTIEVAPTTPLAIEKNIATSTVKSVDLFGEGQDTVHSYAVPVVNGAGDFTPQEKDGIFLASVIYDDTALSRPYHFGNTLATDANGKIIGDLLIQGHTNSGGDWIMNKTTNLKVGGKQQIRLGDAMVTTEITKITTIKKTGNANEWPGFAEALGPNGAIETCKLGVDASGNTVQSGYITVFAIKIIAAKKVA